MSRIQISFDTGVFYYRNIGFFWGNVLSGIVLRERASRNAVRVWLKFRALLVLIGCSPFSTEYRALFV